MSDLECPARLSSKVRVAYKASSKRILQKCQERVPSQSALQECQVTRVSSKRAPRECHVRVSRMRVK